MEQSKDKGLEPLLQLIEDFMTNEILKYKFNGEYIFRFTMGDSEDELRRQQIIGQMLKNGMTIDESREKMGLEPLNQDSLPEGIKYMGHVAGDPATVVQFLQLAHTQDEISQQIQQHKNDINPDASDHGQPDKAMPVEAVNGKTKSPDMGLDEVKGENDDG